MVKLFLLSIAIKFSHAITLNCDFKLHSTYLGQRYSCVVTNFHTTFNDRKVTKITGKHQDGKSNDDVHKIFFKFQNCPYLPTNLGEFFKNLEIFYIMKSNVQHIMPGDLEGLNKLEAFDVSYNSIEEIGKDFFKGCTSIKKISFYDCHIKKVEKGALDPLINLKFASFEYNDCIVERSGDFGMGTFKADLYDKCDGKGHFVKQRENVTACFGALNDTKLSDMIVIVGLVFVVSLLIIITILCVILLKIYQNFFRSNWHEMKAALI